MTTNSCTTSCGTWPRCRCGQDVSIQVIPAALGPHSGLRGAFIIADFDDAPGIAYLETAAEGQTVEEPSIVARVALTFDSLRAHPA